MGQLGLEKRNSLARKPPVGYGEVITGSWSQGELISSDTGEQAISVSTDWGGSVCLGGSGISASAESTEISLSCLRISLFLFLCFHFYMKHVSLCGIQLTL